METHAERASRIADGVRYEQTEDMASLIYALVHSTLAIAQELARVADALEDALETSGTP